MKGVMLIDGDYIQLNLDYRDNCIRYYNDHKEFFIGKQLGKKNNVLYFKNKFSSLSISEIITVLHNELKFLKKDLTNNIRLL